MERPYRDGFWGYVSYAYNDAKVVNEGSSSRAVSNFRFNEALDPNNAGVSTSDFEVEHRFNASVSYRFNRDTKWPTTASLFYNHQSGRPYSWLMGSDFVTFGFGGSINGDGWDSNDLFYVPASADEVVVTGGTWEDLDAFISQHPSLDGARGTTVARNTARAPWSHTLDLHLAQEIPTGGRSNVEITFDILNLANLFDDDAGVLRYVNFNSVELVEVEGVCGVFDDSACGGPEDFGKPVYNLDDVVTDPDEELFDTHNIRSRWRAKLGVRISF